MLPPAAKFQKEDLYTKKYWRRIQNLAKSSGTDDGKKKYFFLTGMSKMAFAILFYYRWMHIKIISLWLWISMFVQIKMLFESFNYLLVHVMVQKQCWIDHKQNCFTCRSRGRFDSLTKRLEKSRYDFFFDWDSLYARLNSHYKAWSYKKKRHKKIKAYSPQNIFRKNLQQLIGICFNCRLKAMT